ncbi:hypothetical protein [Nocardia huaxiensis]|uniref:Mce-associated membrane protein n=1 Tax=Nocardia huaxiensis TaxID=2755382 RepID=A0A7D6ZV51_9NOCA|nr:hypothetical protein [Nocardia huaxiensis]QLY29509.1 hypothetical protein H0264_30300 [Nocardia huaxiensis]UFS96933.1 hypothetical protein LPY97_03085 [Nocardia huaxiensis]
MKTRWKEWSDNGIPIPLLGLAAALLVVATVVGMMTYRNWELSDRNDDLTATLADMRRKEADCTAAIKAGTDFLLASNNFDYRKPEEWTQKMAALTSGPVHDYFADSKVADANTQLITAGKLQKSATVADAACAVQTESAVRVTAQIDEKTQNFQTPDPVQTTSAVWVQVSKVDGAWKTTDSGRGDQALSSESIINPSTSAATTVPDQPR